MELWLLLLLFILHPRLSHRLRHERLSLHLSVRDLFILLRNITVQAAEGAKTIFGSAALQVILCAHIAAADHGKYKGNA